MPAAWSRTWAYAIVEDEEEWRVGPDGEMCTNLLEMEKEHANETARQKWRARGLGAPFTERDWLCLRLDDAMSDAVASLRHDLEDAASRIVTRSS